MFEAQLKSLSDALSKKRPYRSGIIRVRPQDLILYYGKGIESRRLDFTNTTEQDLEHLAKSCDPATFGAGQKEVLDETYRKAGKMDTEHFVTSFNLAESNLLNHIQDHFLDDGHQTRDIRAERYKLNVYGKDAFFKPHKDTPRGVNMFGSLVLVFPTEHNGGALVLRDKGEEWTFDSAAAVQAEEKPSLAYAVFYSDVEHEVATVTSGYRVTVTYNLYFTLKSHKPVIATMDLPSIIGALTKVLADPNFLPDGGYLGFGLEREYPMTNIKSLVNYLKGSDHIIYQSCKYLNLDAQCQIVYEDKYGEMTILCDHVVYIDDCETVDDLSFADYILSEGDNRSGMHIIKSDNDRYEQDTEVHWVTPMTKMTEVETSYIAYGNEPSIVCQYGWVCLIAHIGPAGKRRTAEL